MEGAEPAGARIVNQPEVAGVIRNDSSNMDVTQTFTVSSSGSIAAIGVAMGYPAGTPSLTVSLHRITNGSIHDAPFATSVIPREYFAEIGPQTVPVWIYAEFLNAPVTAGEQIAVRFQSAFAQLWGPRADLLPAGELKEIPGTDLAFRAYLAPEMSVTRLGGNVMLRWSSAVSNGTVEATASLSAPVSWAPVHNITTATNQYWMRSDAGAMFFRLRIP
jgi:hypothetical protein